MTIEFYVKHVYGTANRYIVDPKVASVHQGLTGRKTLSEGDIAHYAHLGLQFKEVFAPR